MDGEPLGAEWEALHRDVARELRAWRSEHPHATLAEIERVVQEAVSRLQAQYLHDVAHASGAADLEATAAEARPRCPACGGPLAPRGQDTRRIVTPRQAAPLELRRSYGVCRACGSGVFPPG